jgi:hypothetical protein
MTPGQTLEEKKKIKVKKKLNQEALTVPEPWGYNFGSSGIGDTFPVTRAGTPMGFGYGSGASMGLSESIQSWMNSEKTQFKFVNKYGDLWEEKLVEAALRLEEAGCGCEHTKMKKSVKKVREGNEGGVNMMGMVPVQRKSDDIKESETWQTKRGQNPNGGLNTRGREQYNRDHGANLKPPQPEGGNRRDSYCARSEGQLKMWPKAAKDPNSRLRKARRKWKCEE